MTDTTGRRQRGWAIGIAGLFFTALSVPAALAEELPSLMAVGPVNAIVGLSLAAYFWLRGGQIGRTVPNRLSILAILVGTVATGVLDILGSMNGTPPDVVYVQHLLMVSVGAAIYAVGAEPRAWPAVAFASALTVAGVLRPDLVMWFTLLTQLLVIEVVAIVSIWGARVDQGAETIP